jgi:sucrose-6-phosphate hydrolase SacC (GH32 family)
VKDFTYNYGQKRLIFTKDDCPGLYLDTTSNSILVVIKTFGETPETILISNITANKWMHFAIVVDQDSVDIYINGVVRQHHTLLQLPKQNDAAITMGSNAAAGWEGVLSNLQYTPRSLSAGEVAALTANVPKDDLTIPPSGPQYYDLSWYIGRT